MFLKRWQRDFRIGAAFDWPPQLGSPFQAAQRAPVGEIFKEVADRLLDSVTISIENRADGRRVRLIKKMPARRGELRDGPKGKIGSDADYNRLIASSR